MNPYHHPDLRPLLLEAALIELSEKGPREFSLRSVAARAGVSHSAPYRHFSDKDALLAALVLEGMRSLTRALRAVPEGSGRGAHGRLLSLGRAYIDFARANPKLITLVFSGIGFKAVKNLDKNGLNPEEYDAFGVLESVVRSCQEEGSLDRRKDSGVLSMLIWSTVHGLSVLYIENVIQSMSASRGLSEDAADTALMDALGGLLG